MSHSGVRTSPAFADLHRPLSADERAQLESDLDSNGMISPLVVWKETGILLDGHNRLAWAERKKMTPLPIAKLSFFDESAALAWAIRNQLGRRNLTPDEAAYLRGKAYNLQKGAEGRPKGKRGQNDSVNGRARERLAKEYGLSPKSIQRDGQFAAAVDGIGGHAPELAQRIRAGKSGMSHAEVLEHARLMEIDPAHAAAAKGGAPKSKSESPKHDPALDQKVRIDEVAQAYGSLCMFLMKMERLGTNRRREYWEHFDKESLRITRNGLEAMRRDADNWLTEITA
jgi:hypothetical protein